MRPRGRAPAWPIQPHARLTGACLPRPPPSPTPRRPLQAVRGGEAAALGEAEAALHAFLQEYAAASNLGPDKYIKVPPRPLGL